MSRIKSEHFDEIIANSTESLAIEEQAAQIEALYGREGRTCYLLGRADRAIETANNDCKTTQELTAIAN